MAARGLASGWPIARIFGIMISVHPTWIVVFALLTFSLAGEILPLSNLADGGSWWSGFRVSDEVEAYARANPGMTERVAASHFGIDLWPEWHYWVLGVIGALGLFVCVLAHELAHSVVALGVGIRVEGITLFIFGGVARIRDEVRTAGAEFRVAAAGPLMSVAIGACCGAIYALAGPSLPAQARALLFYFMFINLALVVFNMVPGFPLDGGRLLRATLWKITGDLGRATFVASWFGRGFAALLMGVAVLEFTWGGFSLGAVWWAVIGLFLWHAAKGGYQQVALREAFAGLTVRDAVRLEHRDGAGRPDARTPRHGLLLSVPPGRFPRRGRRGPRRHDYPEGRSGRSARRMAVSAGRQRHAAPGQRRGCPPRRRPGSRLSADDAAGPRGDGRRRKRPPGGHSDARRHAPIGSDP